MATIETWSLSNFYMKTIIITIYYYSYLNRFNFAIVKGRAVIQSVRRTNCARHLKYFKYGWPTQALKHIARISVWKTRHLMIESWKMMKWWWLLEAGWWLACNSKQSRSWEIFLSCKLWFLEAHNWARFYVHNTLYYPTTITKIVCQRSR